MGPEVNDKELKVIEELSKSGKMTQRELSGRVNLSLGAVNIILKRLATRGFIKAKGLSPKKIEYIITPKGFSEKAKKSLSYIRKTIDLVKQVREEIAKIVLEEFNKGQKKFIILGKDDLADMIELALKGFKYERVDDVKGIKDKDALILVGRTHSRTNGFRFINIADRLHEIYWGVE